MSRKFRGQEADIELEQPDGTNIPVGVLDNPEVTVNKEISELRGTGEITWQDLQQTSLSVGLSGEFAQWDLDAWKAITGYDELADELRTDSEVPTFNATVLYTDTNDDLAALPIKECYDDSLPLGGSRDEWIGMSLDATGRTIEGVDAESDDLE